MLDRDELIGLLYSSVLYSLIPLIGACRYDRPLRCLGLSAGRDSPLWSGIRYLLAFSKYQYEHKYKYRYDMYLYCCLFLHLIFQSPADAFDFSIRSVLVNSSI